MGFFMVDAKCSVPDDEAKGVEHLEAEPASSNTGLIDDLEYIFVKKIAR